MKKLIILLTALVCIASLGCKALLSLVPNEAPQEVPNVPGGTLIEEIATGHSQNAHHFGMDLYNNELYLTAWHTNKITKLSTGNSTITTGYPAPLTSVNLPHGVAVNPSDGTVWICDLNNKTVRTYTPAMDLNHSIAVGEEPVNAIFHHGLLYVADRKLDKIFIVDPAVGTVQSSFPLPDLNSTRAAGYIDMKVFNNKLYLVSDEINGFVVMDLDGSNQKLINVSETHNGAMGIDIVNNKIYINTGDSIVVTDLEGIPRNVWHIQIPDGFKGSYIETVVIGEKIYIASAWGINFQTNTKPPHILVYMENK